MTSAQDAITPVLLTYNEEPNLERTLACVRWAQRVVVLDSGSTDRTQEIARSFANVSWNTRRFDSHGAQWHHALFETGITTEYGLALDADMQVSAELLREIEQRFLPGSFDGGIVPFEYRIGRQMLMSSLYPPQLRLFRLTRVSSTSVGHTHRFDLDGKLLRFRNCLIHDDRKTIDRWAESQIAYSRLERLRIESATDLKLKDRLRKAGLMPLIAGSLAYLRAGGPLRGTAALQYAYERFTYESLLAIRLLDDRNRVDEH
jgi:glycosyltransferase involved in cell wall biosynthesis